MRNIIAIVGFAAVMLAAGASQASGPSTITTYTATPNPATDAQVVTLSATIAAEDSRTCTGTVNFADLTNAVANVCAAAPTISRIGATNTFLATCTKTFTAGVRSIQAQYSGGGTCNASNSAAASHTTTATAVSVPTVGEWSMWALAGLLVLGGGAVLARRARQFGN